MNHFSENKKDVCVELLRIIGCLMVLGTHIKLDGIINGEVDLTRIFISCITGDGVAVFWLILGFFYFNSNDYLKKMYSMLRKIIIPLIVFSILMFLFYNWIVGYCELRESISHTSEEYYNLFYYGLLRWQNVIPGCDHLWYLYVYAIIILLFPALEGVYGFLEKNFKEKNNQKSGCFICGITVIILFLINDITVNGLFDFSHHTFSAALAASIYVITGAFFYKNIENIRGNVKLGILGIAGWIFINIVRMIVQYYMYNSENISEEPLFWFTSFAYVSVICMALFVFGCFEWVQKKNNLSLIIKIFGRVTFYIYLLHVIIYGFLSNRYDMRNYIIKYTGDAGIMAILYEIICTFVIFIISLIIGLILLYVQNFLKKVRHTNM